MSIRIEKKDKNLCFVLLIQYNESNVIGLVFIILLLLLYYYCFLMYFLNLFQLINLCRVIKSSTAMGNAMMVLQMLWTSVWTTEENSGS